MSRKLSAANSSNDGVSDSSSRELRRFRFPPLESSRRHWSDPCSVSSSQETRRFSLSRTKGDRDGGFRNSKKVEVIDVDSEPYGSCSTHGSQGLEVFEFSDEGFQKPKKLNKAVFDPFEYNSSEELEGIVVPPQRKGGESEVFDFSEDVDFQKSKKLNVTDFDPFEYNSSEEVEGIVVPPQRKGRESGVFDFSEDVDFLKSKKLKKADYDPYEYNSSEELEGIVALQQRKGTDIGVFDFSEDVDLWKSKKCKTVGSDPFVRCSSQDLGIPQSRKHGRNGLSVNLAELSMKSQKKERRKNGALEKKKKKKRESRELDPGYIELTDTSMEIQEFGETTEHIDEVNSALDGLKKGQAVRIRRESLLSLLSICGALPQRRLLWAHGYLFHLPILVILHVWY